jgi:hypothetical protein
MHFVYSKLMAWAAVDRGLRLARALKRPVDFDRWRRARRAIRADILDNGWNEKRASFVQAYGANNLDASVLFMPMVGFLPAEDPRMVTTIQAVQNELSNNGFVHRYLPSQTADGVGGDEGAFTMCTLWLAGSLITAGRIDEARAILDRLVSLGNEVGLYSEMVDPRTGEFLGNYPQAFEQKSRARRPGSFLLSANRRLLARDLDSPRAAAFRLGKRHRKDAALVLGGRLLGIDAGGEGNRAAERPVAELAAQVALALVHLLVLGRPLDRQQVFDHGYLDLVGVDAGQGRLRDDGLLGLEQVDRDGVLVMTPDDRRPGLIEQPLHDAAHGGHFAQGLPSNQTSHCNLPFVMGSFRLFSPSC